MDRIYAILEDLRPEIDFRETSSFIEDEIFDSIDIIKLVVALETEFSITIDADNIVPDSFENVDSIIALIQKQGGAV